ncbi:MAG: glycosyltransferase family 2 protein [Oxalobacteraceae bacterium]|nr:MAG: glycosyltransferase family 2 protein [Oxalobacteraceae bacterium]
MPIIVDVLIPAFNAEATIRTAVESIQQQTLRDILIHVVDDGSTDGTPVILAEMAQADSRIHIYRRENGGIVDALNYGLTFCQAEFLARHDADDLAYPERLQVQIDYLRAHADVVAVGGQARHIGADDQPTGTVTALESPDLCDPDHIPSREPYIIHPLLTLRRVALERVGGYRFAVHSEDTDLYWRLREVGRLVNLPQVLADYRLHDASISGTSATNGRIMAVNAQLAGLSARRRRAGRPDLNFLKVRVAGYKQAGGLAEVVELASAGLDADERAYLIRATAAKLLELTTYRPYDLSWGDAVFVRHALGDGMPGVPAERRKILERHVSGAAARLATKGEWRTAFALIPPKLFPGFAARVAMRLAVPNSFHRFIQRRGTRMALGH